MSSAKPTRKQADLAEVLELVLDKGIVINADITITVGDTEMLGIEIRAAIASFETAAKYGLAFPSGTDMQRVEQASGREPLDGGEGIELGIEASSDDDSEGSSHDPPSRRPHPSIPFGAVEEADAEEVGDEADTEEDEADGETDDEPTEEDETETDEDRESAESTPDTDTPETDSEDS